MTATTRLLDSHRAADGPLRILAASGQLGYGIPVQAFERGLQRRPHLIGCDMGSIDPGPYYLGSGEMAAPAVMVRRDLELVLLAALEQGIPLVIGSAGTAGAGPQLDATVAVVRDIASARGLRFRLTTVRSDIAPSHVLDALHQGGLASIGPMPLPSDSEVLACTHIVGQCGTETLARALRAPTDVLISGRACDTAIFAALPWMLGYPMGLCLHMAKIVECTSLCCRPSGRDAMLAELDMDGFTLESMNPIAHATPASVAAHALYEQADPLEVDEPGGTLLLHTARYEALDAHRTRVSGAQFRPRERATLKVEGASPVGARCVLLAGVADPTMLGLLPQAIATVEQRTRCPGRGRCTATSTVRARCGRCRQSTTAGMKPGWWSNSSRLTRHWRAQQPACSSRTCCTTGIRGGSARLATWRSPSPRARSTPAWPTASCSTT